MNATLAQMQANILFWIIIALFAWQGYQRGLWSELIKLAFIGAGLMLGSPQRLGNTLIQAMNGSYKALMFLKHGGIKAVITGNFDAETMSSIFAKVESIPKLVPSNNMDLALFLVLIILIGIGYLVSKLIKKDAKPGLGIVLGVINGFLLSYIFLPLLPDKPPFEVRGLTPRGVITQVSALLTYILQAIFKVIIGIFGFLHSIFGAWTIPFLLFIIIILALNSLTPVKKSGNQSCK